MRSVEVPYVASGVSAARHRVAGDLAAHGLPPDVVDDVVLVVSELLSNALRHARPLPSGDLRVSWGLEGGAVQVVVTDGGATTRPHIVAATVSSTGGRGLSIISDVARDWGVSDGEDETNVWAIVPIGVPGRI
jgi:anti-sigma regulatory factor (Ser/Thr protein kinase)